VPSTLAAIDVGTNSFHLVVARMGEGEFEVIEREKEMVRLGSGAGDMKQLDPAAIERGIATLARFRQIAEIDDAPIRAVATSAVREAENHDEFIRRARVEAGVEVEVISGVEEARLIHLGVLQALRLFDERLMLCDIGGGSTELLIGERDEVLAATSLKLGAVRLTDRFFAGSSLHPSAVSSCRAHIQSTLSSFDRAFDRHGAEVLVGSSGTIEQVLRMAYAAEGTEVPRNLNGAVVSAAQVRAVVASIVKARKKGNKLDLPGLEPRRADIILAGALVLEAVVDRFGLGEVVLSEYALREGVLLDTIQRTAGGTLHHLGDVSRQGVEAMLRTWDDDPSHSAHVANLALELFDATADLHGLDAGSREYLEAGALLANVGLAVAHTQHHKHSYYLIRNSERLLGFTDGEIEIIAQIARYHRKSAPKPSHAEYAALGDDDQEVVRTCAAILRVAIGLDRGHAARVSGVRARIDQRALLIEAVPSAPEDDLSLEIYAAGERSTLLAELLDRSVEVVAG